MSAAGLRAAFRGIRLPLCVLLLVMGSLAAMPPSMVRAATVTVTVQTDSINACATTGAAPCSLRDAVAYANANGGTDISVPAGTYTLTAGALNPTANVTTTITGAGANSTIIDGGGTTRVLRQDGGTLTITGVTLRNGGGEGGGAGGAVYAVGAALTINSSVIGGSTASAGGAMIIGGSTTVTINDTTISGNTATSTGGGIHNNGVLFVNRSTLSGNTAQDAGEGGGAIDSHNNVTVTNSTFSGNTASAGHGGAVYNFSFGSQAHFIQTTFGGNSAPADPGSSEFYNVGTASLQNSIINGACGSGNGASSLGYNLFSGAACATAATGDVTGTNPHLGPLQDNGGPTKTQLPGAAAINKIPNTGGCNNANVTTDQIGTARPFPAGGLCDIGAVEFVITGSPTITNISPNSGSTAGGTAVTITGTNLAAAADVTFGNLSGTITGNTATTINVTTPTGPVGQVHVTVTTPGGTVTALNGYTYTIPASAVTVNTTADSTNPCASSGTGTCSIRDAVAYGNANSGTVVSIPANTYNLTGGDLVVSANMTISGASAKTTFIDPAHSSRVFYINSGATVTISGLTMRNGSSNCCTFDGGGNIHSRGTLTILNSTISGGASQQDGGGISNGDPNSGAGGALTVINSTISGNNAGGGGAIKNNAGASVTVINSTLTGNSGGSQGVLMGNSGPFNLTHVTMSGNSSVGSYTFGAGNTSYTNSINTNGCAGNRSSGGYNIDSGTSCGFAATGDQPSTNPSLGSLGDNGGPTQTMAITTSSPAYNKIPNSGANCTTTDQRGVARPQPTGGTCDIGAYEVQILGASTLDVSGFSSPHTAGVAGSVTVTAKDALGGVAATYSGTVHFTSSDAQAALPGDYTFQASDNGVHTFTNLFTLKTAGTQSITATDTVAGTINGTQIGITVNPANAAALIVAGHASPIVAGTQGTVTVTAKDAFNNTATGYTGTVRFISSDAQATLPADYPFVSGDNGTHTFTNLVTLKTAGTQSITATDTVTGSLTSTQSGISVTTGVPHHLLVTGYPSPTQVNASNAFTVIAKDAFNNNASAYAGTVHFTSDDGQAILPADYPFTAADAGIHFFSATLKTPGPHSITATDTVTPSITGAQSNIAVAAGAATTVTANTGATPQSAVIGHAFTNALAVTVKDSANNPVAGLSITFTAPASGARGTFAGNSASAVVNTDSSGVATATTFTAGSVAGQYTISVTVPGLGTSTPFTLTNLPDVADHFVLSAASSVTAGSAFNLTVTAADSAGNTATGYTGTVHLSSNDAQASLGTDYTFTTGTGNDNGIHIFSITLKSAGSRTVTATQGSLTGTLSLTVTAAAVNSITANGSSTPQTATVGTAFGAPLAATVLDGFGNPVSGLSVTFTAPGVGASGRFTGNVATVAATTNAGGIASAPTFTANTTAGGYTVTANLTTGALGTPASFALTNSAGTPGSIAVSAGSPQSATVNTSFGTALAAIVKDASNNPVPNVVVTFVAPASGASGTFTGNVAAVNATTNASGVATAASFKANTTAGSYTVAASAPGAATPASFALTNNPGAASALVISALASPTQAGVAATFTLTAKDSFGNTATGYAGTVHFTSTDPQATSGNGLPANYPFVAATDQGSHAFAATFKTVGARTLTANDAANSLTANQPTQVLPGPVASFAVSGFPSPVAVNTAGNFTVIARDALGNTASGYLGTVTFSSTDSQIVKPADYPFTPADQGAHTFAATFKTVGAQTLTATDSVTSGITGNQAGISVTPASVTRLAVTAPAAASAGTLFSVTVTAKDTLSNTVTGYTRTVRFTSSDPQAVLPPDYTFVAADNGARTFNVILKAGGSQTITATDLSTASVNGSATVVVSGPTVANISPIYGPTAGGTTVTVTGTNLTGASVVIGGVACGSVSVTGGGTSLTCVTGAHPTAATVDIVITTAGGSVTLTGGFTYAPPTVSPLPAPPRGGPSAPGGPTSPLPPVSRP